MSRLKANKYKIYEYGVKEDGECLAVFGNYLYTHSKVNKGDMGVVAYDTDITKTKLDDMYSLDVDDF